jgi:hypothetical protein
MQPLSHLFHYLQKDQWGNFKNEPEDLTAGEVLEPATAEIFVNQKIIDKQ